MGAVPDWAQEPAIPDWAKESTNDNAVPDWAKPSAGDINDTKMDAVKSDADTPDEQPARPNHEAAIKQMLGSYIGGADDIAKQIANATAEGGRQLVGTMAGTIPSVAADLQLAAPGEYFQTPVADEMKAKAASGQSLTDEDIARAGLEPIRSIAGPYSGTAFSYMAPLGSLLSEGTNAADTAAGSKLPGEALESALDVAGVAATPSKLHDNIFPPDKAVMPPETPQQGETIEGQYTPIAGELPAPENPQSTAEPPAAPAPVEPTGGNPPPVQETPTSPTVPIDANDIQLDTPLKATPNLYVKPSDSDTAFNVVDEDGEHVMGGFDSRKSAEEYIADANEPHIGDEPEEWGNQVTPYEPFTPPENPNPSLGQTLAAAAPKISPVDKAAPEADIDSLKDWLQTNATKKPAAQSLPTEQTPQGQQSVIPGAEAITQKQLAERQMQKPMQSAAVQRPANEGLFDVAGRSQQDLFSQKPKAIPTAASKLPTAQSQAAKYPVLNLIKQKGGVEVGSNLAGELNNIGVNTRTYPGLFKKRGYGGLTDVDNIPHSEWNLSAAPDDGNGYVDRQYILDSIAAERAGNPITQEKPSGQRDDLIHHQNQEFAEFAQHYPQTVEGMHQAARDLVLQRHEANGNEHAVIVNNDTGSVAHVETSGDEDEVRLQPETEELLKNPVANYTLHHTHPSETKSPLSAFDFMKMVELPGIKRAVSHTEGTQSSGNLTGNLKKIADKSGQLAAMNKIKDASESALNSIQVPMIREKSNDNLTQAEASAIWNDAANRAMAKAGIIDYNSAIPAAERHSDLTNRMTDIALKALQDKGLTHDNPIHNSARPVRPESGVGEVSKENAKDLSKNTANNLRDQNGGTRTKTQGVGEVENVHGVSGRPSHVPHNERASMQGEHKGSRGISGNTDTDANTGGQRIEEKPLSAPKTSNRMGDNVSKMVRKRPGIKPLSADELQQYFKPGRIVEGYGGYDKVVAFHPATAADGWSVDVIHVKPDGSPIPREGVRNHSTLPSISKVRGVLAKDISFSAPKSLDEYALAGLEGKPKPAAWALRKPIEAIEKFTGKLTGGVFQKLGEGWVKTFAPELIGPEAKRADAFMAKNKVARQEAENAFFRQTNAAKRNWDRESRDKQLEFIHDQEVGNYHASDPSHLRYKAMTDAWHQQAAKATGKDPKKYYRENYVYHIYKDPEGVKAFFDSPAMIKKYGKNGFFKARDFDLLEDAIRAGFEPKSTNPEALLQFRALAHYDMMQTMNYLRDMEGSGLATPARAFSIDKRIAKVNDALTDARAKYKKAMDKINDPRQARWDFADPAVSKYMKSLKDRGGRLNSEMAELNQEKAQYKLPPKQLAELKNNGFKIVGPDDRVWHMDEKTYPLWKNAMESKGLWENQGLIGSAYRAWMAVKARVIPIKLGLSLFHPAHETQIHVGSGAAATVHHLINGGKFSDLALKDTSLRFGLGNKNAGANPFAANKDSSFGIGKARIGRDHPAIEAWQTAPEARTPEQQGMVNKMIKGGLNPLMSARETIKFKENWDKAINGVGLNNLRLIGTAIDAVPELSAPFFKHWIPGMKAEMYLRRYDDAIARDPSLLSDEGRLTEAARQLAKETERNYGEMNSETQFWNPIVRDAFNAAYISGGWQLALLQNARGLATPLKMGYKFAKTGRLSKADVTYNMLQAYMYTALVLATGAAINKLYGQQIGEDYQKAKGYAHAVWSAVYDMVFPKTADKDKDGQPIRFNQPAFAKEYFMLAKDINEQGVLAGSGSFLYGKTLIPGIADTLGNHDFFGHPLISNPYDVHQWRNAGYNAIEPIALSSADKATAKGSSIGKYGAYLGMPLAGAWVNQTPFEQKVMYAYGKLMEGQPKESAYIYNLKGDYHAAVAAGDTKEIAEIKKDMAKEGMTVKQIAALDNQYSQPFAQHAWKMLPASQQRELIGTASDDEKAKYQMKRN